MREADGSQTLMPVTFRGIDDEMIFVRPTRPDDQISKSMSGGSLLVNGVVVGMLLSVDGGVGQVYQMDDIMRVSAEFFSPVTLRSGDAQFVGEYNLGGAMVKIQSSPAGTPVHPGGESSAHARVVRRAPVHVSNYSRGNVGVSVGRCG